MGMADGVRKNTFKYRLITSHYENDNSLSRTSEIYFNMAVRVSVPADRISKFY